MRAKNFLQSATQLSYENYTAWRALGFVFTNIDQEEAAIAAWQSSNPNMAIELVDWGLLDFNNQKPAQAKIWFERAARVDPTFGDPWFHLGQIYESEGRWIQAAESYKNGLQRSSNLYKVGHSNLLFQLGQLQFDLHESGAAASALDLYNLALDQDDFSNEWSRAQTYYRRGEALSLLERKEEAAASFSIVIEQRPDDYWAYTRLGALVWELEKDFPKTEALLSKALLIDPQNKFAYRNLGQVYQDRQQYVAALEMYQQVLHIDPQDIIAPRKIEEISAAISALEQ